MKGDTVISEKVKCEIERFSQMVTQGLSKPKKRFISQMLFGIQASRDVKLSNIARSLNKVNLYLYPFPSPSAEQGLNTLLSEAVL